MAVALRRQEESAVVAALDDAFRGQGDLVLIAADPGMGKTHLARNVAERARARGARVLWSSAWEADDAPAYWMWTQVVRTLVNELGEAPFLAHAGPLLGPLIQLAPELESFRPRDAAGSPASASRFEVFDAVSRLLRNVAVDHPLVVVLDDVHAADESSLHLLLFVARQLKRTPVFLLATYAEDRRATGSARLGALLSEARKIALEPLGVEQVAELYEAKTGHACPPGIAEELSAATEGNPLFVLEAIDEVTATGGLRRADGSLGFRTPAGVRSFLRRRLNALPEDVLSILLTASVIGRDFDAPLLSAVSGVNFIEVVDRLAVAVQTGILVERGSLGRFSFSHVLLRETLYEDLPMGDRMRAHARIAKNLEERGDADAHLGGLAHHYFKAAQAGDPIKTLDYTTRAAERAFAQTAFEEAARLYRRAAQVADLARASPARRDKIRQRLEEAHRATADGPTVDAAASGGGDRFIRQGDFWAVSYQGRSFLVKDSLGMRYLHVLLSNPGRELHALEIAGGSGAGSIESATRPAAAQEGLSTGVDDAMPVLDAQAKEAYRQRLDTLREELEEAKAFNDLERAARAQQEMDALVEQLSRAVGLGGRDRKTGSVAERARGSVSKALKAAIKKIGEYDPGLGQHLEATIRTGYFCAYTPDPRMSQQWKV